MWIVDFIHHKSRSIFIYVEMDLQYKQMQNLCYTNETVLCLDCCYCGGECKTNQNGIYKLVRAEINEDPKNPLYICMKMRCLLRVLVLLLSHSGFPRNRLSIFSAYYLTPYFVRLLESLCFSTIHK